MCGICGIASTRGADRELLARMSATLVHRGPDSDGSFVDGPVGLGSNFFQTDYTKSVLFLADGTYLEDRAVAQHLGGDQSGMMNETGAYPGQEWLWLYAFWYQIKPFSTSDNADAQVWGVMALLTLGLVFVPDR